MIYLKIAEKKVYVGNASVLNKQGFLKAFRYF